MVERCGADSLSTELIKLLEQVDFGRRYFDCYAAISAREGRVVFEVDRTTAEAVLAEAGLGFKYFTKESFFRYREKRRGYNLLFHVSFRYSSMECGFYIRGDWGVIGGPWSVLARQVIEMREPNFEPSPAAPKLPFSTMAELREVVDFGVSLFREVRDVITPIFDERCSEK